MKQLIIKVIYKQFSEFKEHFLPKELLTTHCNGHTLEY